MQENVSGSGKRLRPHAKAHKCVEIARRQVSAGADGVCVATISEMALLCSANIDVLLTTPIGSCNKADFIARLAANGARVRVVLDHSLQVAWYQEAAERARTTLDVLIDLDVGDHRTGVPCDERALTLARDVCSTANLKLRGVQAYSVSASHTEGRKARQAHSAAALAPAVAILDEIQRMVSDAAILTGGSTGTWDLDTQIPALTELQAGSYPLMDAAYRRIGGIPFANSMTVLTTVISANHPNQVTVDGGFKAFATDRPFGPAPLGLPEGAVWQWAGDEHGIVRFEGTAKPLRPGDRIEWIPPHCDPTVNLHDRIYVCVGDRVEDVWPIKRLALDKPALFADLQ
jgi:D-serine deaminase-like pyridoxal phosphate-dependent protein